ncbi:hypothetical protein FMM05_03055 [Flavobacterium zepuense]|uniref:Uncharacterized protein n=1 Tax=Flavobacterium zepuense TaxID=2593302 RepID=A0A552V7C9_9FLAO|nr:hypothetical protein [Flavobacterium zepuense]TRW26373.1 hypothetical protein FMM05_03055 [Flavobacterium zepuense]
MDTYTMTFKYDGEFDLPNDPEVRDRKVPDMVLEKLEKKEFELVDFNLTENYDSAQAKRYINNPKVHRSVVEIRLDLSIRALKSREAIYDCCVSAMKKGKLCLAKAFENENEKKDILQSIIVFDMKRNAAAASA